MFESATAVRFPDDGNGRQMGDVATIQLQPTFIFFTRDSSVTLYNIFNGAPSKSDQSSLSSEPPPPTLARHRAHLAPTLYTRKNPKLGSSDPDRASGTAVVKHTNISHTHPSLPNELQTNRGDGVGPVASRFCGPARRRRLSRRGRFMSGLIRASEPKQVTSEASSTPHIPAFKLRLQPHQGGTPMPRAHFGSGPRVGFEGAGAKAAIL